MKRKSILLLAFLLMLYIVPSNLMLSSYSSGIVAQPNNPQFVLSSWEYPDEYGQGIYQIGIYGNSTGSWVLFDTIVYNEASEASELDIGVGIRLLCWTWFNSTLTGSSSTAEGQNYIRHNVVVKDNIGATVFSQNNFTYNTVVTTAHPMWFYGYEVILNFLPEQEQYYTATVTYDVFAPTTEEYGTSEESITSIVETLPDDVLFYPDPIVLHNSTVILASSGVAGPDAATNAYTDT